MNLEEKQQNMIDTINAVGDCFEQYNYLIIKSVELPKQPNDWLTDKKLVKGCQSNVWIDVIEDKDRLVIKAQSDTVIIKGVLQILIDLFSNEPVDEITKLKVRIFTDTELAATFTSDRNIGVKSIISSIQNRTN